MIFYCIKQCPPYNRNWRFKRTTYPRVWTTEPEAAIPDIAWERFFCPKRRWTSTCTRPISPGRNRLRLLKAPRWSWTTSPRRRRSPPTTSLLKITTLFSATDDDDDSGLIHVSIRSSHRCIVEERRLFMPRRWRWRWWSRVDGGGEKETEWIRRRDLEMSTESWTARRRPSKHAAATGKSELRNADFNDSRERTTMDARFIR